jgi:nitrite reductase/ring-hydroxylating ferredoxin subunit
MNGFVKAGKLNDIPEGGMKAVKAGGEEILLVKVRGKVYATAAKCTHLGFALTGGKLDGTALTCPGHRSRFDLVDGKVLAPPAKLPLKTYEVKVEGEDVLVKA